MKHPFCRSAAFTLVELMVSTAIIGLIMLVLVSMTNQVSQTWRTSTAKIEKFQEARDGFEVMTRKLSQATLNTYWDYLDASGAPRDKNVGSTAFKSFVPIYYGRTSELRFLSGPMNSLSYPTFAIDPKVTRPGHGVFFQAPFGSVDETIDSTNYSMNLKNMDNLLNTWGFFVEAGTDPNVPAFVHLQSSHVPARWRSRLMEYRLPAEQMSLYDRNDNSYTWLATHLNDTRGRPVRVLAENILTLVILPKLSKTDEDARAKTEGTLGSMLSPKYIYDSTQTLNPGASSANPGMINPKNQLPPILTVTMVAIDEMSAKQLADKWCKGAEQMAQAQNSESQIVASGSEMYMGLDQAFSKAKGDGLTLAAPSYIDLFTDATNLEDNPATASVAGDGDLSQLEKVLTHEKVTYRVFTSNVSIRGAKWSRVQTK